MASRQTIAANESHGRSERGAGQEFHARFNLIAMAQFFSRPGDNLQPKSVGRDSGPGPRTKTITGKKCAI